MNVNTQQVQIGSKVSGSYFGVPFTGTIKDMRNVWSEKQVRVEIKLDNEIHVLQLTRSEITMDLDQQGQGKNAQISEVK